MSVLVWVVRTLVVETLTTLCRRIPRWLRALKMYDTVTTDTLVRVRAVKEREWI